MWQVPQLHNWINYRKDDGKSQDYRTPTYDEMRSMAMTKPMVTHANEVALSGGYVLAAAGNEIYAPRTGLIGSIGVRGVSR